jgi:hypothetical protein
MVQIDFPLQTAEFAHLELIQVIVVEPLTRAYIADDPAAPDINRYR